MLLPLVILAQAGIQFRSRAPLKAHHLLQGRYAAIADKSVRATKFRESRKAPRKKRWIPDQVRDDRRKELDSRFRGNDRERKSLKKSPSVPLC